MRGIHTSHTYISDLFDTVWGAKRHDVYTITNSTCIIDVICKGFGQRFINCIIEMLRIAIYKLIITFHADILDKNEEVHLFES